MEQNKAQHEPFELQALVISPRQTTAAKTFRKIIMDTIEKMKACGMTVETKEFTSLTTCYLPITF